MTPEDNAEYEAALADAWSNTSRAGIAASQLASALRDAVQAGREWAQWKLNEAEHAGLMQQVKSARKVRIATSLGTVAGVVGVRDGGEWVQLSLDLLTPEQAREALATYDGQRLVASRSAAALRHVVALCDRNPEATTVGAALAAEGITLTELLAA